MAISVKVRVGFHCSHEQFGPAELLDLAIRAGQRGFKHISCSDHFAPWSPSQGHSGQAWTWMGAAMAATSHTCGTVCTPGYRYHPAIVRDYAELGFEQVSLHNVNPWQERFLDDFGPLLRDGTLE